MRSTANLGVNNVYVLESTGDIMYFCGGGIIPVRKYNVVQGMYPKIGRLEQNRWQGIIPHDEMPFVINPKSGYIASANNHMTSENVKHGIT